MEELQYLRENEVYAIAPYHMGGYASLLITDKGRLLSKETVQDIMNGFCMMNGSTLNGCIQAARETTGFVKNPPIMLSPKGLFAMQLPCYGFKEVLWIFNLNFLTQIIANGPMRIVFENNHYAEVNVSDARIKRNRWKLLEMQYLYDQIEPDYLK